MDEDNVIAKYRIRLIRGKSDLYLQAYAAETANNLF